MAGSLGSMPTPRTLLAAVLEEIRRLLTAPATFCSLRAAVRAEQRARTLQGRTLAAVEAQASLAPVGLEGPGLVLSVGPALWAQAQEVMPPHYLLLGPFLCRLLV
jgi:hypothetical protein